MANEDKATRYHRLSRCASVAATVSMAIVLAALIWTGGAVWLRRMTEGISGGGFAATVALFALALMALSELVRLPFSVYQGVVLERRYGLSVQPLARWWLDRAKSFGLSLALGVPAAVVVWLLLRLLPGLWWLVASLLFTGVAVAMAHLAPVVLMPLFYRVTPLQRPALEARLLRLATRAGASVLGVFEWRLSDRTRRANAALAGIGRTRRILVSDTLLAAHSDDEIEVILAHELAHHVHRDIWAAIALDALLVAAALFVGDRALAAAAPALGLAGKADPAAMPALVLAAGAVGILTAPVAFAMSRRHERRADRFALDLTGGAEAFVSAMKRLMAQNLAEERPSRLVEMLFHSHPSAASRIVAARQWAERRAGPESSW